MAQSVTLLVFVGLCFIARKFEQLYKELEMSALPFPTELCIGVAPFVRSPAGVVAVALAGAILAVLGLQGRFDARLRKLIVGNMLGTLGLLAFYSVALYGPIRQIQRAIDQSNP